MLGHDVRDWADRGNGGAKPSDGAAVRWAAQITLQRHAEEQMSGKRDHAMPNRFFASEALVCVL